MNDIKWLFLRDHICIPCMSYSRYYCNMHWKKAIITHYNTEIYKRACYLIKVRWWIWTQIWTPHPLLSGGQFQTCKCHLKANILPAIWNCNQQKASNTQNNIYTSPTALAFTFTVKLSSKMSDYWCEGDAIVKAQGLNLNPDWPDFDRNWKEVSSVKKLQLCVFCSKTVNLPKIQITGLGSVMLF